MGGPHAYLFGGSTLSLYMPGTLHALMHRPRRGHHGIRPQLNKSHFGRRALGSLPFYRKRIGGKKLGTTGLVANAISQKTIKPCLVFVVSST